MPETTSDSHPGPRVRELPAVWRERAEYVRDNAGAEQAAHVWEKAASELEVVLRDSGLEPLSLDEAEVESGYSRAHLRRLLRQGVIQNAGTESHPLILRSQLPRKPGCGTFGPRLSVAGRAFEKADGKLYLEWRDEAGRKVRRLPSGVRDKIEAKREADEHAAELGRIEELRTAPMTLDRLLDLYTEEVTPTKGTSKQGHDRRAVRVWKAFFGSQPEAHRRCSRGPSSLDRTDWDRFIGARRAGAIPGWERGVRDRQVGYDLAFMIAVLNWACGRRERGLPVLEASPWRAEVRRAQRWTLPREKSPHRPGMTVELREGLIRHQPNWQFGLALLLERETRRRNSSIRRLLWADVDLAEETVAWRAELDKAGRTTVTALTPAAVEALRTAPSRGIGSAPVFPSATDPSRPTPRNTFQTWLRRAKSNWIESVPEPERQQLRRRLRGVGFHAEKRAGVRDPWFRSLEPQVQEILAGTNWTTLKNVYDEVTLEDQRRVIDAQPKVAGGD